MASEFAVPMMGAMGAVILAGINEDMAMPAYMMLGSIAMLIALLLAAGAVTLPLNSIQALAFGGIGLAFSGMYAPAVPIEGGLNEAFALRPRGPRKAGHSGCRRRHS